MWLVVLFVTAFASLASGYNILGIFPLPSKSHYDLFDSFMVALANRGHNVTVYNTFPKQHPVANHRDVSLKECFRKNANFFGIEDSFVRDRFSPTKMSTMTLLLQYDKQILECEPIKKLRSMSTDGGGGHHYDLLITETFVHDFFSVFAYTLNVPLVLIHSRPAYPWMSNRAGLPDNPSYIPHPFSDSTSYMGFRERLTNTFMYVYAFYFYKVYSESKYDRHVPDFFGLNAPSIDQAVRNASMLFLNSHYSVTGVRPMVPNVKEISGLNIKPANALPENIEKFLNESEHGVVYFCMGSLLRGESFPAEKREAFLSTFAKIPQRVLWKWEGDTLPGKSDNIMTSKWMPQRDILAHPNVKLFISHGGLLGTSEAVYEGVPVLGIPIFGDQRTNLKNIEVNGAGEILEYHEITKEVVFEKVTRLLNNPDYKKNAADLSSRYRDRPMSPLDTAVYWTEYVIRHKGAHHLKTAAVNMPWYQYLLLDVIAFLVLVVVSGFTFVYLILRTIYRFFRPVKKVKAKKN